MILMYTIFNRFLHMIYYIPVQSVEKIDKNEGFAVDGTDLIIVGLAICWGNRDSYYISFKDEDTESKKLLCY